MPPSPRVPHHRFVFDNEVSTQTDDCLLFSFNNEDHLSSADSAIEDDDHYDDDEDIDHEDANVGFVRRLSRLFNGHNQVNEDNAMNNRGTQTAKDPLTTETEKITFDVILFMKLFIF